MGEDAARINRTRARRYRARRTLPPERRRTTMAAFGWRERSCAVEIDDDRIDETVLALLYLTLHDGDRAWKGFDWGVLDRLHQKGLIANPANKAKSVVLTDEGLRRSEHLFQTLFTRRT